MIDIYQWHHLLLAMLVQYAHKSYFYFPSAPQATCGHSQCASWVVHYAFERRTYFYCTMCATYEWRFLCNSPAIREQNDPAFAMLTDIWLGWVSYEVCLRIELVGVIATRNVLTCSMVTTHFAIALFFTLVSWWFQSTGLGLFLIYSLYISLHLLPSILKT